jgi:MFS family permease
VLTVAIAPGTTLRPGGKAADLQPLQLAWLAGAVFVVSAGYGALMPLLPGWLAPLLPGAAGGEVGRHVGFLSGVYAAGVLVGAPLWGWVSDRIGRGRILLIGLVGYVASLLVLLLPATTGLGVIYAMRGATGFFVAAVVPVVSALVAGYTPEAQRARRFAWLGSMSLLGFLFGPGLDAAANWVGAWFVSGALSPALSARMVLVLSALMGGIMMMGLAKTLPAAGEPTLAAKAEPGASARARPAALFCVNGVLLFVLASFELGIVLQGQDQAGQSSRQASIMFALCSLVMLAVNALLFFMSLLDKVSPRLLMGAGLVVAMAGLAVLAWQRAEGWMYLGVSLTSAGTGLVLPVIAYLAAGAAPKKLGAMMGGLAAAAGFGQIVGSAAGGWLFGVLAQRTFGWLIVPMLLMACLMFFRPGWWAKDAA